MRKIVTIITLAFTLHCSAQVNTKPVTKPDTLKTYTNTSTAINVLDNDVDAQGDKIILTRFTVKTSSYTITASKTFAIAGVGDVTITPAGLLTFKPAMNYIGTYAELGYTANDGKTGDGKTGRIVLKVSQTIDTNIYSFSASQVITIETRKDSCKADGYYHATIKVNTFLDNGLKVNERIICSGVVMNTMWNDKDGYYLFDAVKLNTTTVYPLTEYEYFLIAQYGCKR